MAGAGKLGVDIGGVLILIQDNTQDTSFIKDSHLQTPQVPGAFEALAMLNKEGPFTGNIYVVSKCGSVRQRMSLEWLEHQRFYELTGIDKSHVHFCLERYEKAGIAAELGLTAFVDDRLEVLGYMNTVRDRYLFNPNQEEVERFRSHLPAVHVVHSWAELAPLLSMLNPW